MAVLICMLAGLSVAVSAEKTPMGCIAQPPLQETAETSPSKGACKATGMQNYKAAGVQSYKSSGLQESQSAKEHGFHFMNDNTEDSTPEEVAPDTVPEASTPKTMQKAPSSDMHPPPTWLQLLFRKCTVAPCGRAALTSEMVAERAVNMMSLAGFSAHASVARTWSSDEIVDIHVAFAADFDTVMREHQRITKDAAQYFGVDPETIRINPAEVIPGKNGKDIAAEQVVKNLAGFLDICWKEAGLSMEH